MNSDMKFYKLLSVHRKNVNINNIGDYIQALAASQFLPRVDGFVDREKLKSYDGEPCKVIMNGWYMHDTTQWPPTPCIDPLFVAFHMNVTAVEGMMTDLGVAYLKQHEPIGCRDRNTLDILKSYGIDAYFSGCLTLTLGIKYKDDNKENKCYIVDPLIPASKAPSEFAKDFLFMITKWNVTKYVTQKMRPFCTLKEMRLAARFLRTYSKYVDIDTLANADYIQQQNKSYTESFTTDEERLKEAERLVRIYARARLVITSRIHCALPCLGLETPVVFIQRASGSVASSCRFGGLVELFNTFRCSEKSVKPTFALDGKISITNPVANKSEWKKLAANLIQICKQYIAKDVV